MRQKCKFQYHHALGVGAKTQQRGILVQFEYLIGHDFVHADSWFAVPLVLLLGLMDIHQLRTFNPSELASVRLDAGI